MVCVKCGYENPPTSLTCGRCKTLLPQTTDFSLSDVIGTVFLKDEDAAELEEMSLINFFPLNKLEEVANSLRAGEIATKEELEPELDSAQAPFRVVQERIEGLSSTHREKAPSGLSLALEGCRQFQEAVEQMRLFLETGQLSYIDSGLDVAQKTAQLLIQAVLLGQEELELSGPHVLEQK